MFLQCKPLKPLWEKKKLLVTSNFSFSHSVFYPIGKPSTFKTTFNKFKILVCKLFSLEESKLCRLGKKTYFSSDWTASLSCFCAFYHQRWQRVFVIVIQSESCRAAWMRHADIMYRALSPSVLIVLVCCPFPHNDTFWRPWKTSLLKTIINAET